MAVSYGPGKLDDRGYTIGVLCSEFLDQFGEKAEKIISRICYQRGLALGNRVLRKEDKSFENAVKAFLASLGRTKIPGPGKLISLEDKKAIIQGTACPFELNGRGRDICEAMLALDRGIFEEASGKKDQAYC